jgi:uncharacterized protein
VGLGDLKSQLLKKGLVSQKQAKKVAHQERVEAKQGGREAKDLEEEARRKALAAEAERKREADRAREHARRDAQEQRNEALRIVQIAKSGRLDPDGRPNRRWYFVTRDGRIPYLMVDEGLGRRLESGAAALVEAPEGQAWAVTRETAQRLHELEPSWIRCWCNRAARSEEPAE